MQQLLYNTNVSVNHSLTCTHVEFPLHIYFTLLLAAPMYLCYSAVESVDIAHRSKCKALLKTPSPRRAAASVDSVFHNNNQKGKVCLILRLSHSTAPCSLHSSQRLMRTFFPMDDTLWSHYCVIVLFKMHDKFKQQCVSAPHCQ